MSAAAGAITAPILLASFIPRSTTLPMVVLDTLMLVLVFVNSIAAEPVAVNVAVTGLRVPYSLGPRNCFSLTALWDEVEAMIFLARPFSKKEDAILIKVKKDKEECSDETCENIEYTDSEQDSEKRRMR